MAHGPEPVGQHGNAKDQPADCTYCKPAAGLPPYPDGERHEADTGADGGDPAADACERRRLQQLAGVLRKRVEARRKHGGNAGPEQEPRKRDQTRRQKKSIGRNTYSDPCIGLRQWVESVQTLQDRPAAGRVAPRDYSGSQIARGTR